MELTVKGKFIRMSPRKIRLVAEMIKGLTVEQAAIQLQFSKKDAALILQKLLKSAISNAEENHEIKKDNLLVKAIMVNGGPTLDRWMPRAHGRATPIRKRTSHVIMTLAEIIASDDKSKTKKKVAKTDDIVKIGDFDELKDATSSREVKETEDGVKAKKGSKGTKGFSNKLFNRRSGQK